LRHSGAASEAPGTHIREPVKKNGQPLTLTIPPGSNGTLTKQQAAAGGYVNASDCKSLALTTEP